MMVINMQWEDKVQVNAKEDKDVKDKIDILFLSNIKKEIKEDRSKEIHITDLVSPCARYVWYGKKYHEIAEDRIDDSGWKRIWSGHKLHETPISKDMHEFAFEYIFDEEPYGKIVGSIDEIVDNIVIDKKFYSFLPREPYEHHLRQVLYYMAVLKSKGKDVKYGAIYYIERKTMDTRLFIFEADDKMLEEALEEMIEKARYLREYLIKNEVPEGNKGSWICRYCSFRMECLDEESDEDGE